MNHEGTGGSWNRSTPRTPGSEVSLSEKLESIRPSKDKLTHVDYCHRS